MLVGEHRLTADLGTAAAMAVRAGLDSELPTTAGFGEPLRAAIADGRVDRGIVDLAVERILRLKFRLGLFERPYVDAPSVADAGPARGGGAHARGRARPAVDRAAGERRRAAAGGRRRADRGRRADRRQRPGPHGRLRAHAAHRDAGRAAPPGEPVRVPVERRDPADRRGWRAGRRSWTGSGRASAPTGSRTPRARACATAPTRRSPRPSRRRAAPRSPWSWWASARA